MLKLKEDPILEFLPNTLENVRSIYGMDTELLKQSIDIFETWIGQQQFLNKKDFTRDYLERLIINCKGSVERAKDRLERMCTLRTVEPLYFDLKSGRDVMDKRIIDAFLPKTTKDSYRIYMGKFLPVEDNIDELARNYLKRMVMYCEYFLSHDYSQGTVAILDGRDHATADLLKTMALSESMKTSRIILGTFVARIQAVHFLTPKSKIVDSFLFITKHIYSAKVQQRWHFHETLESLHEHIDKDILPAEYGGKEGTLEDLHNKCMDALSTDEFMELKKEMNKATIDTSLKSTDEFYSKYSTDLGQAGTFRKLNVD